MGVWQEREVCIGGTACTIEKEPVEGSTETKAAEMETVKSIIYKFNFEYIVMVST